MPLVGCSADERNRMKLCLAVPLPRLPVVSHPSASGAPAGPSPDSFVPLDGEGQRRPGPPLEVACLQTTTNFLDLTKQPDRSSTVRFIDNNRKTRHTDNFP